MRPQPKWVVDAPAADERRHGASCRCTDDGSRDESRAACAGVGSQIAVVAVAAARQTRFNGGVGVVLVGLWAAGDLWYRGRHQPAFQPLDGISGAALVLSR